MEGERKSGHSGSDSGKKGNLDPGQIHEYDFFVTQEAVENRVTSETERPMKEKKKRGRNKSTLFFVQD
jgi:hypothetical protein